VADAGAVPVRNPYASVLPEEAVRKPYLQVPWRAQLVVACDGLVWWFSYNEMHPPTRHQGTAGTQTAARSVRERVRDSRRAGRGGGGSCCEGGGGAGHGSGRGVLGTSLIAAGGVTLNVLLHWLAPAGAKCMGGRSQQRVSSAVGMQVGSVAGVRGWQRLDMAAGRSCTCTNSTAAGLATSSGQAIQLQPAWAATTVLAAAAAVLVAADLHSHDSLLIILIIQSDLCICLGLAALAALAAEEPQEGQQDEARHTAANNDANQSTCTVNGTRGGGGGGQVTKPASCCELLVAAGCRRVVCGPLLTHPLTGRRKSQPTPAPVRWQLGCSRCHPGTHPPCARLAGRPPRRMPGCCRRLHQHAGRGHAMTCGQLLTTSLLTSFSAGERAPVAAVKLEKCLTSHRLGSNELHSPVASLRRLSRPPAPSPAMNPATRS